MDGCTEICCGEESDGLATAVVDLVELPLTEDDAFGRLGCDTDWPVFEAGLLI